MAAVDINRGTAGISLPAGVSNEIWADTLEASAVMRLARQVPLPGSGVSINAITGDATASWVAESDDKPVSRATASAKTLTPYKLAVIEPFSNEFRRDLPALYNALAGRLPLALAKAFDATVFNGTAPGSNFDVLTGATEVGISGNTLAGVLAAESSVSAAGGVLNGWALSPQARSLFYADLDANNRPLFMDNFTSASGVPQILGAPVYMTKAVYVADADGAGAGTDSLLGVAGDWSGAVFGTVEGVQVSVSDQATLTDGATQINLWQRNMFAVRAEIEIGFRVKDIAEFVQLTSATQA